jgi:hypothetical protein
MAPSTPRKRQILAPNQAQITSFFAPALPNDVASNLLSVGMRVRKSVPEGYKSGTYAFNKHLPSVLPLSQEPESFPSSQESNASVRSTDSSSPRKKRSFDDDEEEEGEKAATVKKPLPQPPASITAWARPVKIATGSGAGIGKKKRGFHQAVSRKDVTMSGTEDFGEADFLQPVEQMEE